MSLTYTTYTTTLANLMATTASDTNFIQIEPSIIDYAEQRCYRELDLLATRVTDQGTATANSRSFTTPANNGTFVVVEGVNVYTPVSTTTTRNQLAPASRETIDQLWPSETAASAATVPTMYATFTQSTGNTQILFGPPPGAAFNVEVYGTIRPTPLSVSNTTTFLTTYLPDLFLAASMVFASGYQKNFSAMSDDPQMGATWEKEYKILLQSANVEEMRKKYVSQGFTDKQPAPLAAQPY